MTTTARSPTAKRILIFAVLQKKMPILEVNSTYLYRQQFNTVVSYVETANTFDNFVYFSSCHMLTLFFISSQEFETDMMNEGTSTSSLTGMAKLRKDNLDAEQVLSCGPLLFEICF